MKSKYIETYYRGFNADYGDRSKNNPHLMWFSDTKEYAAQYAEEFSHGKVGRYTIDTKHFVSENELQKVMEENDLLDGSEFYPYDGLKKTATRELLKRNIHGFWFYDNDFTLILCLWDFSSIIKKY